MVISDISSSISFSLKINQSSFFKQNIAILVFISGLTASDIGFLPVKYQSMAVGVIGAAALIVKIIPENYRVKIAEGLIREEYEIPKESLDERDEDYV